MTVERGQSQGCQEHRFSESATAAGAAATSRGRIPESLARSHLGGSNLGRLDRLLPSLSAVPSEQYWGGKTERDPCTPGTVGLGLRGCVPCPPGGRGSTCELRAHGCPSPPRSSPGPRQFIPHSCPCSHLSISLPPCWPRRIPLALLCKSRNLQTQHKELLSLQPEPGVPSPRLQGLHPGKISNPAEVGGTVTPVAAASSCSAVPWLRGCPLAQGPSLLPVSCGYPTLTSSTQDNETQQTLSYHVAVKQKLPPNVVVNGLGGSDMPVWAPDGDRCRAVGPRVPRAQAE